MTDAQWKEFFLLAVRQLGEGSHSSRESPSWCSWTTFTRLTIDAGYWTSGLPHLADITDRDIADGGAWGQPFQYSDIAHLILPRSFFWESAGGPGYVNGKKEQNISALSVALQAAAIPHRVTDVVLEVKVF